MKITTEATPTAPKVIIYGNAGVGKSTLASKFSKPLFLDIEGGLNYLSVAKTKVHDLVDFYNDCLEIKQAKEKDFDTIVVDSADWLVRLMSEQVSGVGRDKDGNKVRSRKELEDSLTKNLMDSNGGYGKGKEVLENHIRSMLLPTLSSINELGYGIVLIAHAYSTTVMDDDGVETEKILPKIDPPTIGKKPIAAPALIEWVDNVLFLKKENGKRILQLEGDEQVLAKNRLGLTGTVDVDENLDITDLLTNLKEK